MEPPSSRQVTTNLATAILPLPPPSPVKPSLLRFESTLNRYLCPERPILFGLCEPLQSLSGSSYSSPHSLLGTDTSLIPPLTDLCSKETALAYSTGGQLYRPGACPVHRRLIAVALLFSVSLILPVPPRAGVDVPNVQPALYGPSGLRIYFGTR